MIVVTSLLLLFSGNVIGELLVATLLILPLERRVERRDALAEGKTNRHGQKGNWIVAGQRVAKVVTIL